MLRYDEVALEKYKSEYGEECMRRLMKIGIELFKSEDVYIIFEPLKKVKHLIAEYRFPVFENGRELVPIIFFKG